MLEHVSNIQRERGRESCPETWLWPVRNFSSFAFTKPQLLDFGANRGKKKNKKTISTFPSFSTRLARNEAQNRLYSTILSVKWKIRLSKPWSKLGREKTMVKISTRLFSDEKRSDEYLQRRRDDRREGRRERREGWWNFWNQLPPLLGGRDGPLIQRYPVIRSTRINCPSAFNYPIPDIQLTTFHYANHFSRRANFSTRFQFRARGKETKKQRKSV